MNGTDPTGEFTLAELNFATLIIAILAGSLFVALQATKTRQQQRLFDLQLNSAFIATQTRTTPVEEGGPVPQRGPPPFAPDYPYEPQQPDGVAYVYRDVRGLPLGAVPKERPDLEDKERIDQFNVIGLGVSVSGKGYLRPHKPFLVLFEIRYKGQLIPQVTEGNVQGTILRARYTPLTPPDPINPTHWDILPVLGDPPPYNTTREILRTYATTPGVNRLLIYKNPNYTPASNPGAQPIVGNWSYPIL
jgi:hypothetical protein